MPAGEEAVQRLDVHEQRDAEPRAVDRGALQLADDARHRRRVVDAEVADVAGRLVASHSALLGGACRRRVTRYHGGTETSWKHFSRSVMRLSNWDARDSAVNDESS